MKLLPLVLTLLPFACANRIHELSLHKISSVATNPELESAYLADKYGAPQPGQLPLLGAGGLGRRMKRPTMRDGEQLLWTQEETNGGHPVPLSSNFFRLCFICLPVYTAI
jgi:saccharopepsin